MNLLVLDKIFTGFPKNGDHRIAKSLYIDAIIYRLKENGVSPLQPFYLEKKLVNWDMWKDHWKLLSDYKIITIEENGIRFNCVWEDSIHPIWFVGLKDKDPQEFHNQLINDQNLVELSAMKYRINPKQIILLIDRFVLEQKTFQKKYKNYSDCIKHFTYWIPQAVEKLPKESNTKLLGE
jgi:hypothetical protein